MPHSPAVPAVSVVDVQTGNTGVLPPPATAADTLRQFGDKQPNILQRRQPNSIQQQQQQPNMIITTEEKDRQREQRIHRMKLLLEQCDKSDYSEYKKRLCSMTADERNDEAKALEMRQRQLLNQEALELKRMMGLNM